MKTYDEVEAVIRSLTKAQRAVMDRLCTGGNPGASQRTLAKLEALGLIVAHEHQNSDCLGRFTWREYEVPIPIHYVVTQLLSDEYDALSPEEKAEMDLPG